jgi:hypothetical protein
MIFAAILSLFGLDVILVRALNQLRKPHQPRLTTDVYWLFFFAGAIGFGTIMWAIQTARGERKPVNKADGDQDIIRLDW